MSNPNKQSGTNWEQAIIHHARMKGLQAWPLARRGPTDPGDLVIVTPDGDHIVIEARCRQQMGVHRELEKAIGQTAGADLPFVPLCTVLAWLRYELKEGNERRSRVGEPVIVQRVTDWIDMIAKEE